MTLRESLVRYYKLFLEIYDIQKDIRQRGRGYIMSDGWNVCLYYLGMILNYYVVMKYKGR